MEFEWDEDKRQSNLEKHGIDFRDARDIWQGEVCERPTLEKDGEQRFLAIGQWGERYITVVYTWREGRRRIISARAARREEREDYNLASRRASRPEQK